ncbi:MAG: hypothetical protein DBX47_05645 [Clostridiales bacterium]|nr:MAG: hypothetical protein DBX47_05645 [Clostridiales bacterium]
MQKCILVKSVTHAQKAKSLLSSKGISSYISKQNYSKSLGCAWCVKIESGDINKSINVLESGGVKMTGDIFDV